MLNEMRITVIVPEKDLLEVAGMYQRINRIAPEMALVTVATPQMVADNKLLVGPNREIYILDNACYVFGRQCHTEIPEVELLEYEIAERLADILKSHSGTYRLGPVTSINWYGPNGGFIAHNNATGQRFFYKGLREFIDAVTFVLTITEFVGKIMD